ncbi:hypothetical protein PTSG_11822 [Salpingoeca rosetta]|uniref:Indoleamine 2,3-dioxygenase n=1 Tax=Salpingoeca rosetta (strain ATCC 50818 / BSB-021) TaxID=946362 RepID=F2TZK8_SALR5|nr:uncharacterized protein PTSG_11822 [Salpingoeca rosetta]EGD79032.1 hypothetical protein PTSG_11822 [Salpingoeca rosetta]|eukprot:XP_004997988.1 hypothetical protein PTSG_11822 [Salpingoeca rosetta]
MFRSRVLGSRFLSTPTLDTWRRLLRQDRTPLVNVFKPNELRGTLTPYDLPGAFDAMRTNTTYPILATLYDLCKAMPWITEQGTPGLLRTGEYTKVVDEMDNASEAILTMAEHALHDPANTEDTIATLAMLKIIYAHLINNYCYQPCRHALEQSKDPNRVGRANPVIPAQLAQPRTILCTLFDTEMPLYRWQNYNEYSPANCRVLPKDAPELNQDTVTTMVRGEGSRDEIGFIGNHYVQESRTPKLISACTDLLAACKHHNANGAADAYRTAVEAMRHINEVNKQMPQWCSPRGYNQLRIWIPGPRNHSGHAARDLFPPQGVCFEGSEELGAPEYDMSRGETGAMTTIIKLARTMSLFSYDTQTFGENELTLAQRDFDLRREPAQRMFINRTAARLEEYNALKLAHTHPHVWLQLTRLRAQIIEHNITHYGYSRHYIFENKEASTSALFEATGGTTHQFLPTSALANISQTLLEIRQLKTMATSLDAAEIAELDAIQERLTMLEDVTQKQRDKFVHMEEEQRQHQVEKA